MQRDRERERERERERKIILAIMVQSLCVVVGKLTDRVDQEGRDTHTTLYYRF